MKAALEGVPTLNEKKHLYWLAVEDGKTVRFSDLAPLMAKAMHPSDDELMDFAAACLNLEKDLVRAVQQGELKVRNPFGLGLLSLPHGEALKRAVLIPQIDLAPFLSTRSIELRLSPHGSGPRYWTLENAAAAMQEQLGWHDGTTGEFQDQLQEAADGGKLVVLDPRTCLPTHPVQTRTYWELVTPEGVNAWLSSVGAPYSWNSPIAEAVAPFAPRMPSHEDLVRAGWKSEDSNDAVSVVQSEVLAGHTVSVKATKLQHSYLAEERRQRQAKGLFTLCEVAQQFQNDTHVPDGADFLNRRLLPAVRNGQLRAMSESDGFAVDGERVSPTEDYLRPDDVNAWLEMEGVRFRWPDGHAGATRAQFFEDAAAQDVLRNSPEYQSRYEEACVLLEEIRQLETLPANSYEGSEQLKQRLAGLKAQLLEIDRPENWGGAMLKPAQPSPAQAPEAASVIHHSTKSRRDALIPVIELAQSKCRNPKDTAEVWAALLALAEKQSHQLRGATEDGIQFLRNGTVEIFKRDSLRKRLSR